MDGWGDVGGWGDDNGEDFFRPAAASHGEEEDDCELLNIRAQEACEDAGIADVLREMYRVNLAASTIQIAWRDFQRIKKAKLVDEERQEQKCNLFSWAEDQRTHWDTGPAWRPSGSTSGSAFTRFEAMDWGERQDQLWRVAKFFINRGLWVPGMNGALTEAQMQEILKREAGWISAVGGNSDGFGKFEYMSWAVDIRSRFSGHTGPAWGRGGARQLNDSYWQADVRDANAKAAPEPPVGLTPSRATRAWVLDAERTESDLDKLPPSAGDNPSFRTQRSLLRHQDATRLQPDLTSAQRYDNEDGDVFVLAASPKLDKTERARRAHQGKKSPQAIPDNMMALAPVRKNRPPRDHKHALDKRAASRQSVSGTASESASLQALSPQPSLNRSQHKAAEMHSGPPSRTQMAGAREANYKPETIGDPCIVPRKPVLFTSQKAAFLPRNDNHGEALAMNATSKVDTASPSSRVNREAPARAVSASSASSSGSDQSLPLGPGRQRLPSLDAAIQSQGGEPASRRVWRSSGESEEEVPSLTPHIEQPLEQSKQKQKHVRITTTNLFPVDHAQSSGFSNGTSFMIQLKDAASNAVAQNTKLGHRRSSSTPSVIYDLSPRVSMDEQVKAVINTSPWPQSVRNMGTEQPARDKHKSAGIGKVSVISDETKEIRSEMRRAKPSLKSREQKIKTSKSKTTSSTYGPRLAQQQQGMCFWQSDLPPRATSTPNTNCGVDMCIKVKDLSNFEGQQRQNPMSPIHAQVLSRQQHSSRHQFPARAGLRRLKSEAALDVRVNDRPATTNKLEIMAENVEESVPMGKNSFASYSHYQPSFIIQTALNGLPTTSASAPAWRTLKRRDTPSGHLPLGRAIRNAVYKSAGPVGNPSPQGSRRISNSIQQTVLLRRDKPAAEALKEHRRKMGL